ncbi:MULTISPECIES: hypothetical protein [unclassified Arsukibacterium]|uniref:hypothetical protein n=1 Tax=unclassified Arsukibacterium TaxID=2635278 RepID=UPI000C483922|nr:MULTISPECIES: hypothetical protein [unclassified Arsukibacterium]MAA93626.1 hypothetical protein [Rheinheimera sp.]MBM33151.1 hypothetical protein [Rheinheimera sp.]HAW93779.1 hypothetical protein [Candidatus Azambacteria bacterium]|tara:strand:- start:11719 stop:12279 length:561 start_codon:yes stop_codon:yes gene_type:complete
MKIYFTFMRKQRSSALLLILNAGVLLLLYLAAHKYLPDLTSDKNALGQLFKILDIAIWIVEAILLGLALWFWLENKQVRVCVSSTTLSYFDPTFNDVSWQVNILDIIELKQVSDVRQDFLSNLIVLKNGEHKQLMYGNYRGFDRRAFFDALVSANPNISVPNSIYSYKKQRPLWAKRIRKKLGLDE